MIEISVTDRVTICHAIENLAESMALSVVGFGTCEGHAHECLDQAGR